MALVSASNSHGRPREWSPERIAEELTDFARGSGVMPTTRELDFAGREDLRYAVVAHGGVRHWAQELGLQLRERQRAPAPPPEAMVDAARALIDRWGYLPGANKLRQMGHRDLAIAIKHSGGAEAYCREHELPYASGRDGPQSCVGAESRVPPTHSRRSSAAKP